MIRVAAFDLDETLYPATVAVRAAKRAVFVELYARLTGAPPADAGRAFAAALAENNGSLPAVFGALGFDPARLCDETARIDRAALFERDPELAPTLAEVRAAGVRIGILTNNSRRHTPTILTVIGLDPALFDFVLTTDDTGASKPDPRAFIALTAAAGAAPQSILYAGDNPAVDLAPADALGMYTVHVDAERAHEQQPPPAAARARVARAADAARLALRLAR